MQNQIANIHQCLDAIFEFVLENIIGEEEEEPLLQKLNAISACIKIKPIQDEGSISGEKTESSELNDNGSDDNGNEIDKNEHIAASDLSDDFKLKNNETETEHKVELNVKSDEFIKGDSGFVKDY